MSSPARFLLVGNATYNNRGCEAIVRGTLDILRREFGEDVQADAGVYGHPLAVMRQAAAEVDPAIRTFPLSVGARRWSWTWMTGQFNKRLGTRFAAVHAPLEPHLRGVRAALEIGGDNYSLDYEPPRHLLAMDRFLQQRGIPVIVWGASIGPFDAAPEFAREMLEHLRSLQAIFVRETKSREYLARHGVAENVHLVADPAFVMEPQPVPAERLGFAPPAGAIGINLSCFVGKTWLGHRGPLWEMTRAQREPWVEFTAELVRAIGRQIRRDIVLIAHGVSDVAGDGSATDDHALLSEVAVRAAPGTPVAIHCAPRDLTAREIKWLISQCSVFAGARTHSTIASISSGVPTLSIAYSMKALGINHDVFGSQEYCIPSSSLTVDDMVARLERLLAEESAVRRLLQQRLPDFRKRALHAGPLLRAVLERAVVPVGAPVTARAMAGN